jgi:hypothetical protein
MRCHGVSGGIRGVLGCQERLRLKSVSEGHVLFISSKSTVYLPKYGDLVGFRRGGRWDSRNGQF